MEQNIDTSAPVTPATPVVNNKQKNNNGLKITSAIACVLAACGIGFGVYGMMHMNNIPSPEPHADPQTEISDYSDEQTLNIYEINDLKNKTLRLLGSRNGLSKMEYYDSDSGNFTVPSDYMPITKLITNQLDDASKIYITLETTMLDKEKYCTYQRTDGVKADIDAALGEKASNISFSEFGLDCISYDRANDDHYSLWGEDLPKINAMSNTDNGDFAYGSNLDTYYYHIIGGRGGTCSEDIVGKITEINKSQDNAYVNINAGSFGICASNDGKLYSDIERGELYKTIDQNDIDQKGFGLTDIDYESLQSYRFTFKKNSNGIYSFSSVEKI